jgi:tetratricopeptide (TPR) repeat protein
LRGANGDFGGRPLVAHGYLGQKLSRYADITHRLSTGYNSKVGAQWAANAVRKKGRNMTQTHSRARKTSTKPENGGTAWAKTRTKNGKSQNGSRDRDTHEIERLIDERRWAKARALLQEELVYNPADHWLWLTLSLTYYEQKKYEPALKCSEWAVHLEPACPLALWHYAGSLLMCGCGAAALAIWTSILSMEVEEVAFGEHGEGMEWALQLINDVHFRVGRYYQSIGRQELAAEAFGKYVHNRQHGVASIYDLAAAKRYLAQAS